MTEATEKKPAHETILAAVAFAYKALSISGGDYEAIEGWTSILRVLLDLIERTKFPPKHIPDMVRRMETFKATSKAIDGLLLGAIASLEADLAAAEAERAQLETMREGPTCPKCGYAMICEHCINCDRPD
mgnify:CR=1 FL=1|jgi:hypothetical protein